MASGDWRPPNVPDTGGLDPLPEHMAVLSLAKAGKVRRRRVRLAGPGRGPGRVVKISDLIEENGVGRRVDMTPYLNAKLVKYPAGTITYSPVTAYLTDRGEAVLAFYGPGAQTTARHLRLVAPHDRRIPELPTEKGKYDLPLYIAAVFLDTASRMALRRPLPATCTTEEHWGINRRCQRLQSESNGWAACVHCLIAEARHDYAAAYPHLAAATLADSMVIAFEAAEADKLHTDPPADPVIAADLLAAAAQDLYQDALPANIKVARTA